MINHNDNDDSDIAALARPDEGGGGKVVTTRSLLGGSGKYCINNDLFLSSYSTLNIKFRL